MDLTRTVPVDLSPLFVESLPMMGCTLTTADIMHSNKL